MSMFIGNWKAEMWNAPKGFFEALITLAFLGAVAALATIGFGVYFLATNLTFVWG